MKLEDVLDFGVLATIITTCSFSLFTIAELERREEERPENKRRAYGSNWEIQGWKEAEKGQPFWAAELTPPLERYAKLPLLHGTLDEYNGFFDYRDKYLVLLVSLGDF